MDISNNNKDSSKNENSIYDKPLVIGAGFPRTGTTSLKTALNILGVGPTYHMSEVTYHQHFDFWIRVFEGKDFSWDEIFKTYNSTLDAPAFFFGKNF